LKTSIVQTALGVLLVVSAVLFSGLIMSGYWHVQGVDGDNTFMVSGLRLRNPMETWLWFYLSQGLAVLAAGIISLFLKTRMSKSWLALVQAVLGGLVMVSLLIFILWVEPDWAPYTIVSESTGNLVVMRHDSVWMAQQIVWKVASILVGLGVAGLGLAQFGRLRRV